MTDEARPWMRQRWSLASPFDVSCERRFLVPTLFMVGVPGSCSDPIETFKGGHGRWQRRRDCRGLFTCLDFARQGEVKTCAARRVVGSPQAAAMRFNDGAADRQSHTRPMKLRAHEGIEDLVRLLRRQPDAGIADGHHKMLVF